MSKDTAGIRASKELRRRLNELSFELSSLEGRRVSTPDILERTFVPEIIERLKTGARNNRGRRW